MSDLKGYKWCHSNICGGVKKMQDLRVNHLSILQPFVSRDAYLLWKLMTKEERLVQRYYGKLDLDMDMDKVGATLRNVRGSKILGHEKHTSRGASS